VSLRGKAAKAAAALGDQGVEGEKSVRNDLQVVPASLLWSSASHRAEGQGLSGGARRDADELRGGR
jgi:hypothetical protein